MIKKGVRCKIEGPFGINWSEPLKLGTPSHYEHYRRAYIKTENSAELPFWQIVANRLKKE